MDFADRIRELSGQVRQQLAHIQTEEATKNALIMPFISALGYNVFNPTEVTPELHADVGLKKGEKVDYAILKDGQPTILFECKWHGADLSKEHASQLYRYFSVTEARFGVLTNGIQYRFFSDLDAPNKMDARPFFEFNLFDYRDHDVEELKKFSKSSYDLQGILNTASELKYTGAIKRFLQQQVQEPSDEFVRFVASQIYQGRLTQNVKEQFAQTTHRALKQFVTEQVNARLTSALLTDGQGMSSNGSSTDNVPEPEVQTPVGDAGTVVTTSDELEAFFTIKALLYPDVDLKRVFMRDVQSYCGVLLDNNNRRPICRLYLNGSRKYIGLFDLDERKEERISIESIEEIHQLGDRLKATVSRYEVESARM
jgi:hypothetical protein